MTQALLRFFHQPSYLWSAVFVAASTITFVVMRGFPIVKEWVTFKKDILEAKKTELEIKELEEKQSAPARVRLATPEETARIDPKTRRLIEMVRFEEKKKKKKYKIGRNKGYPDLPMLMVRPQVLRLSAILVIMILLGLAIYEFIRVH